MLLVSLCLLSCNQKQELVSTGTWPEEKARQWRVSGVEDVENVAPMGVVPEWAKEQMTTEEYDTWKVVTKVYCVDYSFLKHERFPEERASIYESAKMTADAILAKPDSFTIQRGALFMYDLDPKGTHVSHREAPKVEFLILLC